MFFAAPPREDGRMPSDEKLAALQPHVRTLIDAAGEYDEIGGGSSAVEFVQWLQPEIDPRWKKDVLVDVDHSTKILTTRVERAVTQHREQLAVRGLDR